MVASGIVRPRRHSSLRTLDRPCRSASPLPRLTLWTQGDVQFRSGSSGDRLHGVLHAAYGSSAGRGSGLPQLSTAYGAARAACAGSAWASPAPRARWNVVVNYYDDEDRQSGVKKTLPLQLHLYL